MSEFFLRLTGCIVFLLSLVTPVLAQGSITVTAEVDRTTVSTDDQLALAFKIEGDFQQLGEPQLPLLSGFYIVASSRSSQFSMVNGVVTARTTFLYRLQPTDAGTFTIGPISIPVNGSIYQTDPIRVEVVQGTVPTQTPGPVGDDALPLPAPNGLTGQGFFVEADIDNPTPYLGQQTIYRFRFYQAVNLLDQPSLDWPAFSGFWTEDLTPNNFYEQNIAGRLYRVTEVRRALFAAAVGQITVEPATLTIPGSFFSRDLTLKTEPLQVNVQQLPTGAPNDFQGAVGQFDITAWVEPLEARLNEPVTLFVRVWGTGNLTALPDPTEDVASLLSDWRVYDPQVTTSVNQDGDTIQGEKLFERLLVPRVEGDISIPSFSLVYFNPETSEYRRVETDALPVQVAPGEGVAAGLSTNDGNKQDITLLGSDIRHIKPAPPSLATHQKSPLEQPLYWLGWLVPPLGVAGVWVWDRRRRRLFSDVAYARGQRARRLARRRLAQARKRAQEGTDVEYTIVARALTDYLGDKFNLSASGLTRDAIRQALTDRAVPEDLIDRLTICLSWADLGRFAPVAAGRDATELVTEAEVVVAELEQFLPTVK